MLKFVVPMFSDTLARFGGELPPLTKGVIYFSHHITSYLLFTVTIISLAYLLYYKKKEQENVKKITSAIVLKIPYIGKVVAKSHLVKFAQAMELMLGSHVNLIECIELSGKMINFYPLTIALKYIKKDLLKGDFFYKSIEKQSLFDPSIIALIKIGEEINQLDQVFIQLSKQYESQLEYHSNILMTILEPLMIFLLASLIAVILIAMYLPMFKIGTVIH